MSFKGVKCPVCSRFFEDSDDIVVCPVCGTPHHRECWDGNNRCANENLHSENFVWNNPDKASSDEKTKHFNTQNENEDRDGAFDFHSTTVCPSCGLENEKGSERCAQCGARLHRRPLVNLGGAKGENEDGLLVDIVPPNVLIDGIPAEEMAAYIGPNCTRYTFRYMNMEKNGLKLSFNFFAAFLRPLWCFYRKMFAEGLIYFLIFAVITLITLPAGFGDFMKNLYEQMPSFINASSGVDMAALQEYLSVHMPSVSGWQTMLSYAFRYGSFLFFGLYGDTLYRKKVKRSIMKIRPQATTMPEYMSKLRKKGGTSILMFLLGIVILSMAGYLISYIFLLF